MPISQRLDAGWIVQSERGRGGRIFQQRIQRLDAHGRKMLHVNRQHFQSLQFRDRRVQTIAKRNGLSFAAR